MTDAIITEMLFVLAGVPHVMVLGLAGYLWLRLR